VAAKGAIGKTVGMSGMPAFDRLLMHRLGALRGGAEYVPQRIQDLFLFSYMDASRFVRWHIDFDE